MGINNENFKVYEYFNIRTEHLNEVLPNFIVLFRFFNAGNIYLFCNKRMNDHRINTKTF